MQLGPRIPLKPLQSWRARIPALGEQGSTPSPDFQGLSRPWKCLCAHVMAGMLRRAAAPAPPAPIPQDYWLLETLEKQPGKHRGWGSRIWEAEPKFQSPLLLLHTSEQTPVPSAFQLGKEARPLWRVELSRIGHQEDGKQDFSSFLPNPLTVEVGRGH